MIDKNEELTDMKCLKTVSTFVVAFLLSFQGIALSQAAGKRILRTPDAVNRLRVSGDRIVNGRGEDVLLRGFGLGGMLHMENFIDGYPANEETMREGLLQTLGRRRYDLYFERFYESYFTEKDAEYIHSLGLNLVRIPINYHLFEDDMNPRVIRQDAFRHLDRVIDLCARHGIYTIIDLHALPGCQNQHWHSDNPTHRALFWVHKDFQDRAVILWEAIARRYRNRAWVAGYDLINEPAEPTGEKLFPYYRRLVTAIRKIDPDHIVFLEGDLYATDFSRFTEIWDNAVYTNHDYAVPGFIRGGDYPGVTGNRFYDRDTLESDFLKKSEFMFSRRVPLWVGEFGPVYTGDPARDGMRYRILKDQLAYYDKYRVSWCIWLYKDMGLHAVVHQSPDTPYMRLVSAFLAKKDSLGADSWGSTDRNIRPVIAPVEELFGREFAGYNPYPKGVRSQINLMIRHILIAEALVPEYCGLFRGKTDAELIALAESFRFENCVKRERLADILTGREK
jgi:endoglucanase